MYIYAHSKQHLIWERCSEYLEHATWKNIQRRRRFRKHVWQGQHHAGGGDKSVKVWLLRRDGKEVTHAHMYTHTQRSLTKSKAWEQSQMKQHGETFRRQNITLAIKV